MCYAISSDVNFSTNGINVFDVLMQFDGDVVEVVVEEVVLVGEVVVEEIVVVEVVTVVFAVNKVARVLISSSGNKFKSV